jgi:PilZ domain
VSWSEEWLRLGKYGWQDSREAESPLFRHRSTSTLVSPALPGAAVIIVRTMEKRPESRVPTDITVRVWGMDAEGKPFFQNARASELSSEGAQLSGVHHLLKVGDIIGIQHGEKKSRFVTKWVKSIEVPKSFKVGVHILANQSVPWTEVQLNQRKSRVTVHGVEKRRFVRHSVTFPIVIDFPNKSRPHMQCSSTDIGGRGCYVESLVPLATGTEIIITFWIDSEKITTKGIVRTSDPGVGMGIEFVELEIEIQQRLQGYLDKIDQGFASAASESS